MLGLTSEKLLLITIIAAMIIGPRRLPAYAGMLADFVRDLRAFVESTRAQAQNDLGVPLDASEWQVDLQQYDPRRIVREALDGEPVPSRSARPPAAAQADAAEADAAAGQSATRARWVVAGGTSGHPRRVRVTEAAPEDPVPETDTRATGRPA